MARKKVKLAFIKNDVSRKATYKKRKKGLMKKLSELSILCGVEICAIVSSPYDAEPDVWPSAVGVRRTLARFQSMPESDQSKNMVNQESYMSKRIQKVEEQLEKLRKENRDKEMREIMCGCLGGEKLVIKNMSSLDLYDFGRFLEKTSMEIQNKITAVKKMHIYSSNNTSNPN